MATKKKGEVPVTNSNINTNNNNIINVIKIEQPKAPRETNLSQKTKPNWVVKAIVVGLIGLALTVLGNLIKKQMDAHNGKPAVIENAAIPISGSKVK